MKFLRISRVANHYSDETSSGLLTGIYASFVGVWNLDFFRIIYTPFCLHPKASTLQVLSLDYLIAAYPLVLIVITYTLVTLHYYDYRLVVWLWKPCHRCFIQFRRQWDIQNSLVDAFATFLLLSYVKFLSVSFDILMPTLLWDKWGSHKSTMMYYDGSVEYFGVEHLPYALLAIIMFIIFTFVPILLLCFYHCCWFQRFLNNTHLRSQALHTFVEAFQGYFKDGTDGTKDCRWFAAFYLIIRVVTYATFGFGLVVLSFLVLLILYSIVVFLVAIFCPYKKKLYNILDIFFFLQIVIISSILSDGLIDFYRTRLTLILDNNILLFLALTHMIYIICVFLCYVTKKSKRLKIAIDRFIIHFEKKQNTRFSELLPPRVLNENSGHLPKI